VACFEATVQANWLQKIILGLRVVDNISNPLKICCYNFTVVFFTKNDTYSKGAKSEDRVEILCHYRKSS